MSSFKSGEDVRTLVGEYTLFEDIYVYVKDPLPDHINLHQILKRVEGSIPKSFFYEVESIFVGQFDEFYKMNVNAFFANGTIHVTNQQDNDEDMLDDIVHEIAHAVEVGFPIDIYGNQLIRDEFLGKRKRLYKILSLENYDLNLSDFLELDFSEEFDNFLHIEVGYPELRRLTSGLFASPYSVTSIREYFAVGFEKIFLGDVEEIKSCCPLLFAQIAALHKKYK
jgi:hypothetical protein|tara:strand:+ start:402 stop:1073 length:672 start_codon:yes stop_codon:yes gene_type:complete